MVKLNRQIYLCIKTERITKLFPPVLVPFIYLAVNSNIYCKQNNIFLKKVLTNTCILYYTIYVMNRGVEQLAARRAHNPKVVSSSLTPATINKAFSLFFYFKMIFVIWHKSINMI